MTKTINKLSYIAQPYVEKIGAELQGIFTEDFGELINNHENYKDALGVLSIFYVRISKLTKGTLNLVAEDNLYSASSLLRVLIEHSFKVEFLVEKSLIEQNDNIYKDYLLFCDLSEELQYQKSLDYKIQKLGDAEIDENAYLDLVKRKPELKKYSKNQINEKANQFTFRNIFRFLNERSASSRTIDENMKMFYGAYLHTGALYSDLSSFVHGGPFADTFEFRIHLDEDEHDKEIFNLVENLMVMHFAPCLVITSFLSKLENKYEPKMQRMADIQMEYYKKI